MTNPLHTHTTELDITVAGVTKTHELCVMYTYTPAIPAVVAIAGLPMEPVLSAQVEIQDIKVIVDFGGKDTKTEYRVPMECKCLSQEHEDAIRREILEVLECGT